MLIAIDQWLSGFALPLWRALIWGVASGTASMGVYVLFAPQSKLRALKAAQKAHKKRLHGFDGAFTQLWPLICKDLSYSLWRVWLSIIPFMLSLAPVMGVMLALEDAYASIALPMLGAVWTGHFEFWFIVAMLITSLAIKTTCKIT